MSSTGVGFILKSEMGKPTVESSIGSAKVALSIEMRPLDKIIPYPKNARKITADEVAKVAASIREFGWRQPIVVDKDGIIVIGHVRRQAAEKLGMKEAPVHVADNLSPAQIRALRLADNRLNEGREWDLTLLGEELLDLTKLDFDISLTGFEREEAMEAVLSKFPKPDKKRRNGNSNGIGGLEYRVVVECESEEHQTNLLEDLRLRGYTCKPLIS